MIALPFTALGQLAALVQDTFCLRRGNTLSVGDAPIGAIQGSLAVLDETPLFRTGAQQATRRNGGSCWPIRNDLVGLYQDTAGTLPVTTPGQVIGLSLDQSYGSANLGSELVGNTGGPFTSLTGWAAAASPSGSSIELSGGEIIVTSTQAGGHGEYYMTGLTVGRRYKLSGSVRGGTSRVQLNFVAGASGGYNTVGQSGTIASGASSTISLSFVATSADGYVVQNNMDIGTSYLLSASFKEVLGVHLTQSTGANKPTLTRVPKKLGPELVVNGDFSSGAGWATQAGWSVSGGLLNAVSAAYSNTQRMLPLEQGKYYQVTVDGVVSAGSFYLVRSDATNGPTYTASGKQAFTYQHGSGTSNLYVAAGASGFTGSADNISVREVLEWSNAYQFDGSNDTLTFTPPAITTAATLGWAGVISDTSTLKKLLSQPTGGFGINVIGNALILDKNGTSSITKSGVISTNTPIVLTAQIQAGGVCTLRVNGAQVEAQNPGWSAGNASVMYVNSDGNSSYCTPGAVSDVMVENSVIPLADLKAWERNACNQLGIPYPG